MFVNKKLKVQVESEVVNIFDLSRVDVSLKSPVTVVSRRFFSIDFAIVLLELVVFF